MRTTEQAYRALRHHGPLTDGQLAWWLGVLGLPRQAAPAARRRLLKAGRVRWTGRARQVFRGHLAKLWEAI